MTRLPDFPWDRLVRYRERAASVDGGIVDLSIGTPVDHTPHVVQQALGAAADAPGYPTAHGTSALRDAVVGWCARHLGVAGLDPVAVIPLLGSKEFISWLPALLGLGPGSVVMHPELAYPTYDVSARVVGATPVRADATTAVGPGRVDLMWLNSPANPHGQVLPVEHLAKSVAWARERGTVLASDECYHAFGWESGPVSVLHPDVNGGSLDGILAVHSLSKQSNLAGYRAGFVTGDPALIARLLEVRKHMGMLMPLPVQAAMAAALSDDAHLAEQRARYLRRRALLRPALEAAGFRVDHSEGSLYLWSTRDESCWDTVDWLASRGILVAPGEFYGPTGGQHVRVALTATDERIDVAVDRLTSP
jgi:succinyldiaminopimelate transaminase